MDNNDFLNAMTGYKFIDKTQRFKYKWREKKRKELASKKRQSSSEREPDSKRPYARASTRGKQSNSKNRKFCQYCKDNNGKYWTHDTADCYFKKLAKGANTTKKVQKELDEVKNLIKNLRKRSNSDSDKK